MRSQRGRNVREFRRPSSKRTDSRCYHYVPRGEFLAIRHDQLKPARIDFDATNMALIQIRDSAVLVPTAVINKTLQRNELWQMIAVLTTIFVKRQRALWIGNVRSSPIRPQTHSGRHLVLPKC